MIFLMGLMALFALYTGFVAFHKPCRSLPGHHLKSLRPGDSLLRPVVSLMAGRNQTRPARDPRLPLPVYRLEFRAIKDKREVNVYEDDDETLLQVSLIDASVGFILLCSDFLFFFDSRQHMIEWRN